MEVAPSSSQYHRLPGRSSHLLLPWPGILSKQTEGKGNLASNNNKLVQKYSLEYFLGPRGPLVPPLVDPSDRQSARKIWIYTGLYAYESSQDPSNESDGPVGSPRCPPWPQGPPINPQWPLNRSVGLIELLRSPHLLFKSSEDPSNVAVDPMGQLTPRPWTLGTLSAYPLTTWDPVGLLFDPLGPSRPTPWPLPPTSSRGPI